MADVINLRMARKAKARSNAANAAEANRIKHGRTKSERDRAKAEADRTARELDGKKRDF